MDSILNSVKKKIGLPAEYKEFDEDLIMDINSAFLGLNQIGVGPEEGYAITGEDNTWDEFISNNILLEAVKSWTALKVRLLFDPPQSGVLVDAIKNNIAELEWRIQLVSDPV